MGNFCTNFDEIQELHSVRNLKIGLKTENSQFSLALICCITIHY